MIKGSDLENRMETEAPARRREPRQEPPAVPPLLIERVAAARALQPPAGSCRSCFIAGRDGVVSLLELPDGTMAEKLRLAGALRSRHFHASDNSFQVGRDAAIAAATGG
jgi:hypothetical protein